MEIGEFGRGFGLADAGLNESPERRFQERICWEAAAASDRGRRRAGNEDCCLYSVAPDGHAGIFTVCDGMGGAAGGETASRLAAEAMLQSMNRSIHPATESGETLTGDWADKLLEAAQEANRQVYGRSRRQTELAGMGTTLVALAVRGGAGWLAHVGDSRCYRLRAGGLERLTQDHSLVEEQVRAGQMTRQQAERSPLSHVLTRAVGTEPLVQVEITRPSVSVGDLYLLCSDGLTRELADERLAAILDSAEALDSVCARLVEAANLAGGRDNITCLLARALRADGASPARGAEWASAKAPGRETGNP
jgi:protein phosphatase